MSIRRRTRDRDSLSRLKPRLGYLSLKRRGWPVRDGLFRMVPGLRCDVCADSIYRSGADRFDVVTLRPFQLLEGVLFAIREHRASAFQTLQQPGNAGRWMESQQKVQVGLNDPERHDAGTFLLCHGREEALKECRDARIDQGSPIARGPDDVNEESIAHGWTIAMSKGLAQPNDCRLASRSRITSVH